MKTGKVIIVISGGLVQRIVSDHDVEVHIIDHDNAGSMDDFTAIEEMFTEPIPDVEVASPQFVQEVIEENVNDYKRRFGI